MRSVFKSCFRNRMFALVPYEVWRDLIVAQLDVGTLWNFVQLSKGCKNIAQELGPVFLGWTNYYKSEDQIPIAAENLFKARLCLCASEDAIREYEFARIMLLQTIKRAKFNEMNARGLVYKE